MSHLHTDVLEEDAADLQFPKDCILSSVHNKELDIPVEKKEIFTLDFTCLSCKRSISEPYIRCAICKSVLLCLPCFADGWEKADHKNSHSYTIVRNNFTLFQSSDWSVKEEKKLLDCIHECGLENWKDISIRLIGRSPDDCKQHYLQYYIYNKSLPGIPQLKNKFNLFLPDSVPYVCKLNIEEPPRFLPWTYNYKLVAGYNPARSDFEFNFDNDAEVFLSNLIINKFHFEDFNYFLGMHLQFSIACAYNERLKERTRRKKIIQKHGLISQRKSITHFQRYNETVKRPLIRRFKIFYQLLKGIEIDSILECIHKIEELKSYIRELFNYRKNGIRYFHNVLMFQELSKIHQKFDKDKKTLYNIEFSIKNIMYHTNEIGFDNTNIFHRKIAPPLDIYPGMTGYQKLTLSEKTLCSNARIFPDSYLYFKQMLVNEYKKCGCIKLAQARQLLKIDVNKTKKIYDYLIKEGHIHT